MNRNLIKSFVFVMSGLVCGSNLIAADNKGQEKASSSNSKYIGCAAAVAGIIGTLAVQEYGPSVLETIKDNIAYVISSKREPDLKKMATLSYPYSTNVTLLIEKCRKDSECSKFVPADKNSDGLKIRQFQDALVELDNRLKKEEEKKSVVADDLASEEPSLTESSN